MKKKTDDKYRKCCTLKSALLEFVSGIRKRECIHPVVDVWRRKFCNYSRECSKELFCVKTRTLFLFVKDSIVFAKVHFEIRKKARDFLIAYFNGDVKDVRVLLDTNR